MTSVSSAPKLVIVAAKPEARWVFFRGQVRLLRNAGLEVSVISAPGPKLAEFQTWTGADTYPIPMKKSGLPGMCAAALAGVPCASYFSRPPIRNAVFSNGRSALPACLPRTRLRLAIP